MAIVSTGGCAKVPAHSETTLIGQIAGFGLRDALPTNHAANPPDTGFGSPKRTYWLSSSPGLASTSTLMIGAVPSCYPIRRSARYQSKN